MTDFESGLNNVRSSLRIIYLYTQRMLETMKYIGNSLDLRFQGGYVKEFGSPTPRNGKGNLDNWAWDWVNIYLYEFSFLNRNEENVSILLQSDSGFWDSGVDSIFKVSQFASPLESRTRLLFIFGDKYWDFDRVLESDIMRGGSKSEHELMNEEKSGRMLVRIFDLTEFDTETRALDSIRQFVGFLEGKGIHTTRMKNAEI